MSENAVAVIVRLEIAEARLGPYLDELATILSRVRKEPECLSIHGYQDSADPTKLTLLERWTSTEAFQEFEQTSDFLTPYLERARNDWTAPREMEILDEVA